MSKGSTPSVVKYRSILRPPVEAVEAEDVSELRGADLRGFDRVEDELELRSELDSFDESLDVCVSLSDSSLLRSSFTIGCPHPFSFFVVV